MTVNPLLVTVHFLGMIPITFLTILPFVYTAYRALNEWSLKWGLFALLSIPFCLGIFVGLTTLLETLLYEHH